MENKTQTSTISLKTLRGVFEQPKMNHRRDFLRENKLNLRELQKITTQKLTQQKQELERKQNKHLQKFQKTYDRPFLRRSASQCRNVELDGEGRQFRITAGTDEGGGMAKSTIVKAKPNYLLQRPVYSQQRQSMENLRPISSCCCNHQQRRQQTTQCDIQCREQVPRSVSSVSVLSKTESCDKEIQTDDISDEDFLHEALKKCNSSEVHQIHKQKSIDQLYNRDNNLQCSNSNYYLQQCEPELKCIHTHNQAPCINHNYVKDHARHEHKQHTSRSQNSHIVNGHIENYETEQENVVAEDLEHQFQNLKLGGQMRIDGDQHSSARSSQTLCSTSIKKRPKLGCREDLCLPRYLEKEKREKEEERLREINKDHNCPLGHYALSEEDRLKALNNAQKKMASLINELNHMPMTTETLRIRNRKAEIEKELTQIEMEIRLYSKPKVYLKESIIQY